MTPAPGATPALLRRVNATSVVEAMRMLESPNVSELVAYTGLSRPTVDAAVDWLIDRGVVEAATTLGPGERGRPARRLSFSQSGSNAIGIDMGADSVRVVLTDLAGNRIADAQAAIRKNSRQDGRIAAVQRAVTQVFSNAGTEPQNLAAAIGLPGIVDPHTGVVRLSTRVPSLTGLNLGEILSNKLGCPVIVENDANLAALGEQWRGSGQDVEHLVYITATSEAGSGIIVNGQLVRGYSGGAGELGFVHLWESGLTALAPQLNETIREAISQMLARFDATGPRQPWREPVWDGINLSRAAAAAAAGDSDARDYLTKLISTLSLAAASLTLILNPEVITIGGGNHTQLDLLTAPIHQVLTALAGVMFAEPPRVEESVLGDQAVALGGARLALEALSESLLAP